ncbi:MAG TPA: amidase family protein [Jatrophihabitans sp.]|nr:amidase family protein [Jatrophihabitans sp.]
MTEPEPTTAAGAAQLLGAGAASSAELTAGFLRRIERLNPLLNAVIATAPGALADAAASDDRRRSGTPRSPLDGIPVLIKDNIEALGLPGSAGSRALLGSPPVVDAALVARLRAAGLVVLGAANLSEWANFRSMASTSGWSAVGGQARNPHDPDRNTSGSSSGSASAVAAGLAPFTVGTETDGSIVSPAGVCGVVGFKPTVGTVPGAGVVPVSPVQDTAGPMARTVADATALYRVLAGVTAPLPPVDLAGLRVASWRQPGLPAEVAAMVAEVERLLGAAGAVVVPAAPYPSDEPASPFEGAELEAMVAEFSVALPAYLAARPGAHPRTWPELLAFNRADEIELSKFSDEVFQRCAEAFEAGGTATDAYRTARAACDADAARGLAAVLGDCAFAISPSNGPAWPIQYGVSENDGVLTSSLCAITGSPSITLPAGSAGGLPLGISLLGRRGSDLELLGYAAAVERLLPQPKMPVL